jgi:U32 family peptidase
MEQTKKIELLAPAGSWEALEAAVNAGADAVYMGGKAFGARQYASNFDREEMTRAVYFAHMHRVRLYITVNTLVDDSELKELADYLLFLNNVGVDGIIVQDLGVIRLARKIVPELPLHASTQMTVTNSGGVEFAVQAGLERTVLARELSLKEIKAACDVGTEIETFIHGALCVCYSGQCLMSSLIGGRSGNRGRCAQPCRLPYKLVNKAGEDMLAGKDAGQYLLSPKDMNTLSILPQLIETGVISYKIEGRMKRPEYVAVVVDAYRRAIDTYLTGDYQVPQQDFANIEQIFNRDFTTAYLTERPGKKMMSDRRPNNRGVLIGRVAKLDKAKNKAVVKLEKELHLGDGLEFWVSVGGRVGTTVTEMRKNGQEASVGYPGDQVMIDVPNGVRLNDRVFRTLDSALMSYAQQFFGPDAQPVP